MKKTYKEIWRTANGSTIILIRCPICDGLGIVKDKITNRPRKCVGCNGDGKIKDVSYP